MNHSPEKTAQNRAISAFRRQWILDHHGAEPEDDDVPPAEQWAYIQETRRLSGLDPDTGYPLGEERQVRRRRSQS
ncbi:hypothetical protein ACFYT4_01355 [Streptomyces sp. NPDC004609]|uniref:hypothetical protein n=1 Tax=Streptomyces sp. NPDC004609 TaxID=3364704 RepID=UPI0036BA2F33